MREESEAAKHGSPRPSFFKKVSWAAGALFASTRRSRLRSDLSVFESELDHRASRATDDSQTLAWIRKARLQANDAHRALERYRAEQGWAHLEATRRTMIECFDAAELRTVERSLRKESIAKVTTWRRKAIESQLDDVKGLVSPVMPRPAGEDDGSGACESFSVEPSETDLADARVALREAMAHRDEYLRNDYRRIELLRRRLAILMAYLVADIALLLGLQLWLPLPIDAAAEGAGQRVWVYVLAWGILGGAVSAILSVIGGAAQSRVPDTIRAGVITGIRPWFGAAGAMAAYVFLFSGALGIDSPSVAGIFGVAFAGGFSENLIVRAMGGR
jgi:hypothetical protein